MYQKEFIEDLILENRSLRKYCRQLKVALEESEKKYSDFLNRMVSTESATSTWLKEILNGNVIIKNK